MPIISRVGRKSFNNVVAIIGIYVLLVLGSITMVYPFGIMLTASISSRYDYDKFNFMPDFFGNEHKQFGKFLFEKYDQRHFAIFASNYRLGPEHSSWRTIAFDNDFISGELGDLFKDYEDSSHVYQLISDDFNEFKSQMPAHDILLFDTVEVNNRYWRYIRDLYLERTNGDEERALVELRRQAGLTVPEFRLIIALPENTWEQTRWFPSTNIAFTDWVNFKSMQEKELWSVVPTSVFWQRFLSDRYGLVDKLNKAWGIDEGQGYESFWHVPFHGQMPNADVETCRDDMNDFLRMNFPRRYISLSEEAQRKYHAQWVEFIERRNVDGAVLVGLEQDFTVPATWPRDELLRSHWMDFLLLRVDPADYSVYTTEDHYRRFLQEKYGSIESVNAAYESEYASFSEMTLPARIVDIHEFKEGGGSHVRHYMARNYIRVFEFLVLKGRALFNTLVLVSLTIFATLTVNPMAAYALSRYSMKSAHKVLIFFLATMAFPPGVTMIPNFLLMRSFPLWQLAAATIGVAAVIFGRTLFARRPSGIVTFIAAAGAAGFAWLIVPFIGNNFQINLSEVSLLNTYAALIVPGLANGFSIFLLKGFFDSLPKELYEAGMIDGASEFTMFRLITIPLCKPILAVIALGAFNAAYSGFMWAFIVCQKQSMWTIMVWLYQFQMLYENTEPWMVMASLVVVSVPTLLMFLFCQRIILRGIIIPQMK